MAAYLAALFVFAGSHVLAAYPPFRRALTGFMGERGFLIGYSLVSVGLLVVLFDAYGEAPTVELWPFAEWTRRVPLAVMPIACILTVAGLSSKNPLSIGAGGAGYDPARPGIVSITRHPVIWALILWSASHLPPNGDVKSVLLFGLLTALGLYGPRSLDRKRRASLGEARWRELAKNTANLPLAGPGPVDWAGIGMLRILGGLALYAALLAAHPRLFGVDPLS